MCDLGVACINDISLSNSHDYWRLINLISLTLHVCNSKPCAR